MSVNWYYLECFRLAGRLEHFSKAAKALHTSQPAISRAVGRLEEQLGVLLFERTGRSVRLTEHGRLLLNRMDKAYREIEDAQNAIMEMGRTVSRPIRIGFMRSLASRIIPQLVSYYREQFAHAQFRFVSSITSPLVDLLEADELDLIFSSAPQDRPSIKWSKLYDQRFFAIGPHDSPLLRGGAIGVRDLANHPLITFRKSHSMRAIIEGIFESAGATPNVVLEAEDSNGIPGFVAAGLGIAILAQDGEFPKDVALLPTNGPLHTRPVGLAWAAGRLAPDTVKSFQEFTLRRGPQIVSEIVNV
jgi:DNA-binding transcriptional LysR family regulator